MKRKPMRKIVYLQQTMPSHIMHGRPQPSGSMACLMVTLLLLNFCDCQKNVSQMSPKSSSQINEKLLNQAMSKTNAAVASTKVFKATTSPSPSPSSLKSLFEENNTRQYIRVMRSAQPILNDNNKNHPNISPNNVHVTGKYEKEAAAGRYYQYNIKPTGTHDTEMHNTEAMYMGRSGKTLKSSLTYETDVTTGHFLGNGDQRHTTTTTTTTPMSRVPSIQPTVIANNSVTSITSTVTVAPPLSPRQNSSPDIQDIITGIVKLLNGNVNVHANTQGVRRPAATRINNRGPPRISDVQAIPFDYENQKPPNSITAMRPAHFSFERPDRPFITGVPIPEQIVPYRPNFVSNHPPWHRTKPRPPINTNSVGGRRPIPQYKPLPSSHMKPPQEEETAQLSRPSSTQSSENVDTNKNIHTMNEPNDKHDDSAAPTISSSQDTEVNSSLTETFYNATDAASMEELSHSEEVNEELQPPPDPSPTKKEDSALKKKPNKFKTNEKKKLPSTEPEDSNADANPSSKYISMSVDITDLLNNDHTTEEVIFMTASKTPELDATKLSSTLLSSTNVITTTPTTLTSTSTSTSTLPLDHSATSTENIEDLKSQINPTLTTSIPILTTTTSSIITTSYSSTTTTTTETTRQTPNTTPITTITPSLPTQYHPRPGIVLDDPEFKPGGSRTRPQRPAQAQHPHSIINPTRQQLPPGYGEIFDVTLSAIQGPGSKSGSQHTINIKPYGSYSNNNNQDIIISAASGEDGFVSIDGTRTYINLFGDPIDPPNTVIQHSPLPELIGGTSLKPDGNNQSIGNSSSDSSKKVSNTPEATIIAETDVGDVTQPQMVKTQQSVTTTNAGPSSRPHYRPRTTQPPVRIDTCIVGDDSTCDQAQHERCKTENGVSSCHCRPGYSRRKHREPCRRVITFCIGMRVDRIYEHRIVWDNKLADRHSEPYGQLSYESIRAMDSAMSMTPYSDEFMEAKVNNIYHMEESSVAGSGVFVNLTIKLDESIETLRPNLRSDVQKHLLGVLHRRNNNIGKSVLFVTTPEAAITPLRDLDECRSHDLNDCHVSAMCSNVWGSFRCTCPPGTRDHWAGQPHRAGRECLSCADAFCNNRGTCSYNAEGQQLCNCDAGHYGSQCEIDGEVLGVAIGASVAAVIIIVLTLICLVMWSRRWQREQKNAIGSPVFGYMSAAPLKSAALLQSGYQLTLEDRMRWAQVADVMSPTNYYGTEPIGPTRPSSAMFAYPNLPIMGVNTITNMPMQSSNMQQMHQNSTLVAPPVPMPRGLGLSSRTNGMRTLENSSSSEEEDRTDLLGRNFQVPRPKSRSNGSITNQSGIYYDVDYQPSGNGIGSTSVDRLYGSQNPSSTHSHISSNQIPGPQGIPMSTYTSGRASSSYYIK